MLKTMVLSFVAASFLSAAPQAVVFDWGQVMAHPDRKPIASFLAQSLKMSPEEFEKTNLKKKETQKPEIEFWVETAARRGILLPPDWTAQYKAVSKSALNIDEEMYALAALLKEKGMRVALLSNVQKRYSELIRSYGLYEPFSPCLLSGEVGIEKPDPKAYEMLLGELSLPASAVIFVDDKPENIEAARQLGIDAILFESASQLKRELGLRGL